MEPTKLVLEESSVSPELLLKIVTMTDPKVSETPSFTKTMMMEAMILETQIPESLMSLPEMKVMML